MTAEKGENLTNGCIEGNEGNEHFFLVFIYEYDMSSFFLYFLGRWEKGVKREAVDRRRLMDVKRRDLDPANLDREEELVLLIVTTTFFSVGFQKL